MTLTFPNRRISKTLKWHFSEKGARVIINLEARLRRKALKLGGFARKIPGQGWFLCASPEDRDVFLLGPLVDHRLESALDCLLAGGKVDATFQ